MSVQAISLAIAQPNVTPAERLLLIILANYADPKMICWPSQATMANDTGYTDRTIRSLLTSLEEKGLLKRKERFSKGRMTSALIMLTMRAEMISTHHAPISGEGGNPRQLRAEMISDKPTSEPLKEPLALDAPLALESAARSLGKEKKIPPSKPRETQAQMAARLRRLS